METRISSSLMGHQACIQTLPSYDFYSFKRNLNIFVASVCCERLVKLNLCFILSATVICLLLNSMNMLRIRLLITIKIDSHFFKKEFSIVCL